ncbi:Uma2 family endonuclease [Synechococcus sp. C9]|uniref:Uma2 family endonuclease n=1 Tax=Synechococcus sp. C9 TaxID=102119 RepID=UPI001FF43AC4|nr:Uma2 family endonuclease [Synechococcus sp. C9]
MTTAEAKAVIYPDSDGEPLAETQTHVWVILSLLSMLSRYLGERAVVFADQFFYYIEGNPRARVAPDVMVVFGIEPGMRRSYKLWEEGQAPGMIMEVTSEGTREMDWGFKKRLYEQIGVREYWLFDPLGEWIEGQLQGYRLDEDGVYRSIKNPVSEVLGLRLQPGMGRLDLYRLDNGEKLLTPDELAQELIQKEQVLEQTHQQLAQKEQELLLERQRAERLAAYLRSQGINPDEIGG